MNLHQFIAFIAEQRQVVFSKGWTKTRVNIELTLDENGVAVPNSATISPKMETSTGELKSPKDKDYLYYSAHNFGTREYETAKAAAVLSVAEDQNARLFAMIEEVKIMAEDAGLPADFVNPIVALADQLRSNALVAPIENNEVIF